ncbi:hypothetical protein GCM10027596_34330 [Nocardioides korecus]
MSLHPVRHELRTFEQLHTFLRLRARDSLGDQGGAGLRLLRELRLAQAEVRSRPDRRGAVIVRLRRLALAHRAHPDFDEAWELPSPDAHVSEAMDLLVNERGVDLGTAAQLLTAYAEVARCELVDAATVVIEAHADSLSPDDSPRTGDAGDLEPA